MPRSPICASSRTRIYLCRTDPATFYVTARGAGPEESQPSDSRPHRAPPADSLSIELGTSPAMLRISPRPSETIEGTRNGDGFRQHGRVGPPFCDEGAPQLLPDLRRRSITRSRLRSVTFARGGALLARSKMARGLGGSTGFGPEVAVPISSDPRSRSGGYRGAGTPTA